MASTRRGAFRQYWVALRMLIIFTVVTGIVYPIVITLIGQAALPAQANGSLITEHGKVVGSSLIGQSFTDKKGNPLPQWFQSRPSAAGNGYDPTASSGSNQGTESATLIAAIKQRQATIEKLDGVTKSQIPADAVTASASGLDPDISPAYALLQVNTVAKARGLNPATVRALVEHMIQGSELGFLGEPTVNVLQLNLAL